MTNSFGMSNPMYFTGTSTLTASGLRSSAHTSSDAGDAAAEVLQQPGQRQAGVDDVLEHQHVLVGDVAVEVLEDPHDAGGAGGRAVGGDGHELHLRGQLQGAREVAHEQHGALEDADQQDLPAGVVRRRSASASSPILAWICSSLSSTWSMSGP